MTESSSAAPKSSRHRHGRSDGCCGVAGPGSLVGAQWANTASESRRCSNRRASVRVLPRAARLLRVITVADEAELLERYNIGAHMASVYLSGVPGYYCDEITGDARSPVRQRIEYWPGLLDQSTLDQRVEFVNGGTFPVGLPERVPFEGQPSEDMTPSLPATALDVRTVRLGDLAYARSGDKGGVNNVGVWVKDPADYEWLRVVLGTEALGAHVTELKEIEVERHEFPNLNAVHFLLKSLLGTGGSSSLRVDRLGKAVGEYLRTIPVPAPRTPGL